jgi:acetoin utilization deacetylase AcuC-like enzyme
MTVRLPKTPNVGEDGAAPALAMFHVKQLAVMIHSDGNRFNSRAIPTEVLGGPMIVSLFTDARMMEHRVPFGHPERPERLQAVMRHLERCGFFCTCPTGFVREATIEELSRIHDAAYLRRVAELESEGGGMLDADTWLHPGSHLAARLAAGAAIEAVAFVLGGDNRRAFCLVRPPGHHARPSTGMGFCIYDNIAVCAAAALARYDLTRLLVVDFDVHHGNGTQEVFYNSPSVGFLSIHRYPFYPGTGARDETGTGPGLGNVMNIPLPHGTPRPEYHAAFRIGLEKIANRIRPELVLISAGFDAHAQDPIGDLGLEIDDFEVLTREIVSVAETHAHGRIVSVLEGGYNVPILAGSVAAHLQALGADAGRT